MSEEDPSCNYCQMLDRVIGHVGEEITLRAYPRNGTIEVVVNDRVVEQFDELTLSCLCGRRS